MWILRVLAQFKGSERSSGLLQDFEDGYVTWVYNLVYKMGIKLEDSPSYCKLNMV